MKKFLKILLIVITVLIILATGIFFLLKSKNTKYDNEDFDNEQIYDEDIPSVSLIKDIQIEGDMLYIDISIDEVIFEKILEKTIESVDNEELKKSDISIASDRILIKYPLEFAGIKTRADIFLITNEYYGDIRLDIDEVIVGRINIPDIFLTLYIQNLLNIENKNIKKEGSSIIVKLPKKDITLENIETVADEINIRLGVKKEKIFNMGNEYIEKFLIVK